MPNDKTAKLDDLYFHVESMVAARNLQPYVVMKLGKEATQMTPARARMLGKWMMEVAEAAEQDGFILAFMTTAVGLDKDHAGMMLRELREYRGKARNEGGKDAEG